MRFVIYGAGGIGGTIGARLFQTGHDVHLLARGAHFEAIARDGLRFVSPTQDVRLSIPCSPHPRDVEITPEDAVVLCMKTQHTEQALRDLRDAVDEAHVICCQNGVENERLALRRFPQTYGMVAVLPAEHLEPGVVVNFAEDTAGLLDAGCYPGGTDDFIVEVTAALAKAGFSAMPDAAIMRHKHAKLLNNLSNTVEVALGRGDRDIARLLREEALACYQAAGIDCADVTETRSRRGELTLHDVPGQDRHGSSSLQSVLRGTGDIETDYLNGEIVLLGRQHVVPTPANTVVQRLGRQIVGEGRGIGSVTLDELERMIDEEARSGASE